MMPLLQDRHIRALRNVARAYVGRELDAHTLIGLQDALRDAVEPYATARFIGTNSSAGPVSAACLYIRLADYSVALVDAGGMVAVVSPDGRDREWYPPQEERGVGTTAWTGDMMHDMTMKDADTSNPYTGPEPAR
jgi:hypothetical protein